MERIEADAVIIGGGATGACVARDLSLRGVSVVLIEREDLASGTTGRNHGLLHSGARYAVTDMDSATECISENRILRRIARHCVESTGGIFATLPDDDPSYHNRFMEACRFCGIDAREISAKKALELEPSLNPSVLMAATVPDGTIDPFRYTAATTLDASEHGAVILTHTMVTGILKNGTRVTGVTYRGQSGAEGTVHARIVINASGPWAGAIASLAGIELRMFPAKGSMVILDYRVNRMVVNRCRVPSDGDIVVPGDTVSLIGTTSSKIGPDEMDDPRVSDEEIDILMSDGEKLIPSIRQTRVLRAYCGVRPLVDAGGEAGGRGISRGVSLIDHKKRDGLEGLITIAGGKLMTSRLMAEMTSDLACGYLNVKRKCSTRRTPLPGSENPFFHRNYYRIFTDIPASITGSTFYRHGRRMYSFFTRDPDRYRLVCECEMVTEGEIEYAVRRLNVNTLVDLRRRTRLGMGPCQGTLCAYRAAGLMGEYQDRSGNEQTGLLKEFLEERWKGVRPVLWGDGLRETEFTYWLYQGLLGMGPSTPPEAGPDDERGTDGS